MLNRSKTILVLTGVLASGLLLRAQVEVVERVLVRVNGNIVTQSEFELRQIQALQVRPELQGVPTNSPLLLQAVADVTPGLILDAVDELLLVQRGREMGFALSDEDFEGTVSSIQTNNGLEDPAEFDLALRQEGLTMVTLRRALERQHLVSAVRQNDVFARLVITDEEARAYYDANLSTFATPMMITLRELLIAVPAAQQAGNVTVDNAALEAAESARVRAQNGESFTALVAELSDSASAANGGLIGPLNFDELAPVLQERITQISVGEVTEVLRTQRGYQILRLESRTQPRTISFEEMRDEVGNRVAEQKSGVEMQQYLERLRDQATIEWRSLELEEAYLLAVRQRRESIGLLAISE